MPLYEYVCPQCGTEAEHLVRLSAADSTLVFCEHCPVVQMERKVSAPSFTFGPGRSPESRAAHSARVRSQLEKRSLDYDNSPVGQDERGATIERLRKIGTIPEGMKA